MRLTKSILLVLALGILLPQSAQSQQKKETVRILSGGPGSVTALKPKEPEMEKFAGADVEFTVQPVDVAMNALAKGLCEGVIGGDINEIFMLGEKKGMPKQNQADYQWVKIGETIPKIGVHPDNPVKAFTKEQITGILSGKIKTWESITGEKLPITIHIAKNYVSTERAIMKYYLGQDKSPVVNYTLTREGQFKAMQNDKGAIGFFNEREGSPEFTPKFFITEVSRPSNLLMRKNARPEAQKVFEFISKLPMERRD